MNSLDYLKKYYDGNIDEAVVKLNSGIPVQYIVGNVDFFGFTFKVDDRVLIPRFETEELVDKTVKYIRDFFDYPVRIVDLGTGSGCIGITLSKLLGLCVDAVDISASALEVAKGNSKLNNASVNFYLGNLFEPLSSKYDVIISNPPYISYDEEIDDVVRNNEPSVALYACCDGLYFYQEIFKNCRDYLNDRFLIALEIGCTQGDRVKDLALKYLPGCRVLVLKDLSFKDRFVFVFSE